MANLPIDVRALVEAGARLQNQRNLPVRIAVLIELDAPDELIDAARDGFRARTANALVDIDVIDPDAQVGVESSADAAVVIVGSGGYNVVPTLAGLRRRSIPTVALAIREHPGEIARLLQHPVEDVITGIDPAVLVWGGLADWFMDHVPDKRVAVAHNFEFTRRAAAKEAVRATAWQNGLIGGVSIIPGTDMPIMTLNQGKMLLQIAAAYGQHIGPERVKELAVLVGGGFVFRAFARQALTLVPGF
ncbi:MAG TPA: DUF697 domain-containing protein, partial [Coriobacteriia bacterium]